MSEKQPPTVVEGATTGDVEDEIPAAKSAEDRKAASALASLEGGDDSGAANGVDAEAAKKALGSLGADSADKKTLPSRPNVKVNADDVELLVDELEVSKTKATELLKAHDGDAVKALRAYVSV